MKKSDIKILLVDDEPDILEIVEYNLKLEGYQIYTANNGIKGIKSAENIKPHWLNLEIAFKRCIFTPKQLLWIPRIF